MKSFLSVLLTVLWIGSVAMAEIQTDWAYHSIGDGGRFLETIPGQSGAFVEGGSDQADNDQTIRLFLLTAQQFAGDMDEQDFVRWWDGTMAHWVQGQWVENITLKSDPSGPRFHDLPLLDSVTVDLWRIEIPPWITQPGENFYAIQLKAFSPESTFERYLLSRSGGDFTRTNNLGQIWSASEEFDGQDWKINVWQQPIPPPPATE